MMKIGIVKKGTAGINKWRISLALGLSHSLTLEVNLAPGLSGMALAKRAHMVTLGAWLFKAGTVLPQPHCSPAYTDSISNVAPSQSVRLHQCK